MVFIVATDDTFEDERNLGVWIWKENICGLLFILKTSIEHVEQCLLEMSCLQVALWVMHAAGFDKKEQYPE